MIVLGCHCAMKAPNYLFGSIQEALSYKANACMVYTGAPSNSKRKPTKDLKIKEAHALMKKGGISDEHLIVHAPYIINLANTVKPEVAEFGMDFLTKEIQRTADFGVKIMILHPGSHVGAGKQAGIQSIIQCLNTVLDHDSHNVKVALETMAGKGSECGITFEELAAIKNGVHRADRIGFCMDTCHIHDAGYDLSHFDEVLQTFDRILGLENLLVMHINDSKNTCGSHADRHANIGKGTIGFEILHDIVHHRLLEGIPMILETPWFNGKASYKEEIKKLRCA